VAFAWPEPDEEEQAGAGRDLQEDVAHRRMVAGAD
jgi:hypothetical protein